MPHHSQFFSYFLCGKISDRSVLMVKGDKRVSSGGSLVKANRKKLLKTTRGLRMEELEVRRVFDTAMAELWSEMALDYSHGSAYHAVVEVEVSEWQSGIIDDLVASWGIGFAGSSDEVSLDWMGQDGSGLASFKLNVGDYQWEFVIDQGIPSIVNNGENLFHNHVDPADVNGDETVNAIDALVAINYINRNGGSMMLPSSGDGVWMENNLDVNGDRWISAMDALAVINQLKQGDYVDGSIETDRTPWDGDVGAIDETWIDFVPVDDPTLDQGGSDGSSGDGTGDGDGSAWEGDDGSGGSWVYPVIGAAKDDFVNVVIGIDEPLPDVVIDVLANDEVGTQIVEVSAAMAGEVQWVSDAAAGAPMQLRYVPGPTFNGYDSFLYSAVDAGGNVSTARVYIKYEQEGVAFGITTPQVVDVVAGEPTKLVDANGKPLISIDYDGVLEVNVGVWISWVAPQWPYNGDTFSGRFVSEGFGSENGFYDDARGGAWIYGSIDEVNRILGGLTYEPAPGFAAVDGAGVSVYAYLYDTLQVGFVSAGFLVKVPLIDNAPVAKEDDFWISDLQNSYALDVLANDLNGSDSAGLELVDVRTSAHSWASEIEIDTATGKLTYRPTEYFNGLDVFAYTVRNKDGLLSQGIVRVWLGEPQ
jgi:CheY-specific phosphatase CheX